MQPPVNGINARRYRHHFAVGLSVVFSLFAASPFADFWTRAGGDYLTPLAAHMVSGEGASANAPIAVVVIDEITHNTPPFSETPEIAWTPYLGEVISALDDANPAVIGLDIIYPKTIAGRGLAPGFDRTFLQALAKAGRRGKLVLSETRLSQTPIRPYMGQEIAVGGAPNIRANHLTTDVDNVVRRHPAFLDLEDGGSVRSFAAEIAARMGADPKKDILINFIAPRTQFPAYRFSDIYECISAGKAADLQIFNGKAVLIGAALDIEDRHVAGNRFQQKKEFPVLKSPCGLESATVLDPTYRASTSGVLIEARAVDTFLRQTSPRMLNRIFIAFTTLILLLALALTFLRITPFYGFSILAVCVTALWVGGAYSLAHGVLMPIAPWIFAGALSFVAIYSYRVILEDQSKRWVTHAFRHYLSPDLVTQLAEEPNRLMLGGERRNVAVLFADLAGFTTTSEQLSDRPEELVEHLNNFFEIIAEKIEVHDGYIDKFIGDAVMGVWGAPVATLDNERKAAEAALACVDAVNHWNEARSADSQLLIHIRIGVSAGEVIAGNLGSADRFNYTVIGDAVNRAARLEQENKRLGTQILVDAAIAKHLPTTMNKRFIEETPLRGQTKATKIYALER